MAMDRDDLLGLPNEMLEMILIHVDYDSRLYTLPLTCRRMFELCVSSRFNRTLHVPTYWSVRRTVYVLGIQKILNHLQRLTIEEEQPLSAVLVAFMESHRPLQQVTSIVAARMYDKAEEISEYMDQLVTRNLLVYFPSLTYLEVEQEMPCRALLSLSHVAYFRPTVRLNATFQIEEMNWTIALALCGIFNQRSDWRQVNLNFQFCWRNSTTVPLFRVDAALLRALTNSGLRSHEGDLRSLASSVKVGYENHAPSSVKYLFSASECLDLYCDTRADLSRGHTLYEVPERVTLRELSLERAPTEELSYFLVVQASSLRALELRDTDVREEVLAALPSSLVSLSFWFCRFKGEYSSALSELSKLNKFEVRNTEEGLVALNNLPNTLTDVVCCSGNGSAAEREAREVVRACSLQPRLRTLKLLDDSALQFSLLPSITRLELGLYRKKLIKAHFMRLITSVTGCKELEQLSIQMLGSGLRFAPDSIAQINSRLVTELPHLSRLQTDFPLVSHPAIYLMGINL